MPIVKSVAIIHVGMGKYASMPPTASMTSDTKNRWLGTIVKQKRVSNMRYIIK